MEKTIELTNQEQALRQLLLDTSEHVGKLDGCQRPELRFTGGWVRDKLLGITSHDIDISIDCMTGHHFGTLMKQYLERQDVQIKYQPNVLGGLAKIEANPDKSKHLETITTKILGFEIDLVNLRKETYSEDSRNPTMEFGSPREDALRRDATVNALFYNLSSAKVEDFTGRGLQDLELKVIKTPLPPLQTFKDDPLRVLRAIRFASRLNYKIAIEDKAAMSDDMIKEALKAKISRERVGIEIIKMMRGPNPHMALSLIDTLGLYDTIFTYADNNVYQSVETYSWSSAYNLLLSICNLDSSRADIRLTLQTIQTLLVRDVNDLFLAWMLACFVPWAREPSTPSWKVTAKKTPCPASIVARQGLKADSKICKVVDDSVMYLQEIESFRDAMCQREESPTSPLKRKAISVSRDVQGQAIRSWGSSWRSMVLFALLTNAADAKTFEEREASTMMYATWLRHVESLDLLDVHQLKPLVNGNQIAKALGAGKVGPWMKKAMDIAMEWQLRNPDASDPAGGVQEVLDRKRELGVK